MTEKIKVTVVNDSTIMRMLLCEMISSHDKMQVLDTARDGFDALVKIKRNKPEAERFVFIRECQNFTVTFYRGIICNISFNIINKESIESQCRHVIAMADFKWIETIKTTDSAKIKLMGGWTVIKRSV